MRIAQISFHTSPLASLGGSVTGGMNVYLLELSRELAAGGHSVDMFTRREDAGPRIERIASNLRLIRIDAGPNQPLERDETVPFVTEFVGGVRSLIAETEVGYDVVHSHYWQSGLAGHQIAEGLRAPHVVMFHTLGEVKNRARVTEMEPNVRIEAERQLVATADVVMTASSHERDLLEHYYAADPERLETIPCGVNLDLFRPLPQRASRRALGLDEHAPVLLWVGRLEKLKGVDILIEALAQLDERDFTLVLVGGDDHARDLKEDLRSQAAEAGLTANIRFEGAVAHERLPLYYSAADVCVVPSYYESFGLVAVEAMACGTPVVASRVGGLVSTVTDGVTGYLIPWRCPEPFAEKLEVILNNPELRTNFGVSARRSVERFRWQNVAGAVADLYERVISRNEPTATPAEVL